MDISKLRRIKDTSKYYKLLLRYLSMPIDQDYILSEEEKSIFMDDGVYNQFILDLIGRIILSSVEDYKDECPSRIAFDKVFDIESSNSSERKDQMYQIRNCFAHSLTENTDGEHVVFDNGKIKGKANIANLALASSMLYSDIDQVYEVLRKIRPDILTESFEDYKPTFKDTQELVRIAEFSAKKILANRVRSSSIKSRKELAELLDKAKMITIPNGVSEENVVLAVKLTEFISHVAYETYSPSGLKKLIEKHVPDGDRVRIKSLFDYKEIINGYIDYVGEETFFSLDYKTQQDIIQNIVAYTDNTKRYKAISLSSILLIIEKFREDIREGKKTFSLASDSKTYFSNLTNRYLNPFRYETVLQAYMYNRFIYLKELLNTNQIDETVLDYSSIDIDDIEVNIKYSKKDITDRKNDIDRLIEVAKAAIETYKKDIEKEKQKREKMDNPKNPKREEQLQRADEKIEKKKRLIEEQNRILDQYEKEREYINAHGFLPVRPIDLFRVLRNSTTHGFTIGSRQVAYTRQDLGKLKLTFEDHNPKTTIYMSAERTLKLIEDIESVVIGNVDRINRENRRTPEFILGEAIDVTECSVSTYTIEETVSNVEKHKRSVKERLKDFFFAKRRQSQDRGKYGRE